MQKVHTYMHDTPIIAPLIILTSNIKQLIISPCIIRRVLLVYMLAPQQFFYLESYVFQPSYYHNRPCLMLYLSVTMDKCNTHVMFVFFKCVSNRQGVIMKGAMEWLWCNMCHIERGWGCDMPKDKYFLSEE